MSVIVRSTGDVKGLAHNLGHLAADGKAVVPDMPADTNPGHFLATATPGGRIAWALTVARVAAMAASVMTYGDDIAIDGRPSWDPDDFDKAADAGCVCGDAVDAYGMIGSFIYNAVSNGGADFLPAAAAAILTGTRDSLPVRRDPFLGVVAI